MTDTDLVKTEATAMALQMKVPLVSTAFLKNMSDTDIAVIGDAFPGKWDAEEKMTKARMMVAQFSLYIDTLDKPGPILKCITQSIAESMMTLASLDLQLTKSLGQAALVPYGGVCTVSIMYRGLCELIYRAGTVDSISTGVVYEGDTFEYELGTNPNLTYRRGDGDTHEDKITHAWAIAHSKTGPDAIEVMDRVELDKVRAASKRPTAGAWKWAAQMFRKAPLRRLAKFLQTSISSSAQNALALGLEMENSQYDLGNREHYAEIRQQNSEGFSARRAKQLGVAPKEEPTMSTEPMETPDLADNGKIPPPEGNEDAELLAQVTKIRSKCESSMTDQDFIDQVTLVLLGKAKPGSKTEFNKVWNAIVNELAFDIETADQVPE